LNDIDGCDYDEGSSVEKFDDTCDDGGNDDFYDGGIED
jgi:hypothetical protein